MLKQLLEQTGYDKLETKFLVDGFTHGFSLGYQGPTNRRDKSKNIPFTVGDKYDMWNKLMKEVECKRVAGPFEEIPFEFYVQSPIGLVPKVGNKTRLIFHLSYTFKNSSESIITGLQRNYVPCIITMSNMQSAIVFICCKLLKVRFIESILPKQIFRALLESFQDSRHIGFY